MEGSNKKEKKEGDKEERKDEETNEESDEESNQKKKQKKQADSDSDEGEEDDSRNVFLQNFLNAMLLGGRTRATGSNNEELVKNMKANGVLSDRKVEEALLTIPRDIFVPEDLKREACVDSPLRLATLGFNVSAPHMYAVCLQQLNIQPGNKFLDIGSGCGHFTALGGFLAGKTGKALGLDLREDIIKFAKNNIKNAEKATGLDFSNVSFEVRNCFLPAMVEETYDRIHSGACCPEAKTQDLLKLLAPNGILVTPLGDRLVKISKDDKGNVKTEKLLSVAYSDLIIPSEAEVKEAKFNIERAKAQAVNVPPSTYPGDLANLLNRPELADVIFKVEGKSIYCHRVILGARSEHFKAMFFNGLKESKESEVNLPDMQYDIFMDVLKYIYSDQADIKTPDRAIEIIGTANYLKLDRLKAICEAIIKDCIEVENAAYILQVASRHEAWQLKSFTMDFIMDKYEEVSKTKCFDELDKNLLVEVTKAACKYLQTKTNSN